MKTEIEKKKKFYAERQSVAISKKKEEIFKKALCFLYPKDISKKSAAID